MTPLHNQPARIAGTVTKLAYLNNCHHLQITDADGNQWNTCTSNTYALQLAAYADTEADIVGKAVSFTGSAGSAGVIGEVFSVEGYTAEQIISVLNNHAMIVTQFNWRPGMLQFGFFKGKGKRKQFLEELNPNEHYLVVNHGAFELWVHVWLGRLPLGFCGLETDELVALAVEKLNAMGGIHRDGVPTVVGAAAPALTVGSHPHGTAPLALEDRREA